MEKRIFELDEIQLNLLIKIWKFRLILLNVCLIIENVAFILVVAITDKVLLPLSGIILINLIFLLIAVYKYRNLMQIQKQNSQSKHFSRNGR